MKNYEKYADEIREYKGTNFCRDFIRPYIVKKNSCADVNCARCSMLNIIWLMEEYEEPEPDWRKVEVDTPVLVRNSDLGTWEKRYFSEYKHGYFHCWNDGRTSWNATHCESWNYAKLAEEECEK